MKTRPILFSAPMVRAILAGTKTQTRRVVKLTDARHVKEPRGHRRWHPADPNAVAACPYGQPGDRLWVRETHAPQADCWGAWQNWDMGSRNGPKPIIHYAADNGDPFIEKWRPSIHMPRWACRILLEIVSVRVERLQDISEEDAISEGVFKKVGTTPIGDCVETWDGRGEMIYALPGMARTEYRILWESINGPGSWAANPLVWVVEFLRRES